MTDWPLTFKCNDNCISCINNTKVMSKTEDPPLWQAMAIIDSIDPKADYLGLSGGEPTMRKEFFDVLRHARERHPELYIFVVSNGRMFSYMDFARRLAGMGLGNFRVAVSLYSHRAETHDAITRAEGSFEQTTAGIRNLLELRVPTEVRTVINRLNYRELPEIAAFIAGEFPGIDRAVFMNMKITGNAYINREQVLVKISDVVPYAAKAARILRSKGMEARLYHFPLCTLPRDLWPLASGITKAEKEELTLVKACGRCKARKDCPEIWKSYACLAGDGEFKAVGNR